MINPNLLERSNFKFFDRQSYTRHWKGINVASPPPVLKGRSCLGAFKSDFTQTPTHKIHTMDAFISTPPSTEPETLYDDEEPWRSGSVF